MAGLTLTQMALKESEVEKLLDEPAKKFLKTPTITAMITRAYNLIFNQITIDTVNQAIVTDAIYAIAAWHSFGTYGNSISAALSLQDIGAYRANLEHYKEVAMLFTSQINVDLSRDVAQTLSDELPIIKYGGSLIDIDRTDL